MGIKFNADEIFQIAEDIETNGARFYRKAAGIFSDQKLKKVLNTLADMEDQHKAVFAMIRNDLSSAEIKAVVSDPDNQLKDFLQVMAGGYVFDIKNGPDKKLTGKESPKEIFALALTAEKDSIVFYQGIKDFVPVKAGKDKIEQIIKEEMNHIVIINHEARNFE